MVVKNIFLKMHYENTHFDIFIYTNNLPHNMIKLINKHFSGDGRTALHIAVEFGNSGVVECLLGQ